MQGLQELYRHLKQVSGGKAPALVVIEQARRLELMEELLTSHGKSWNDSIIDKTRSAAILLAECR